MLKAYSRTSFYLNNELIDTTYIEYMASRRAGSHKKLQAVAKLKVIADSLVDGYQDADENTIRKWIQEAK